MFRITKTPPSWSLLLTDPPETSPEPQPSEKEGHDSTWPVSEIITGGIATNIYVYHESIYLILISALLHKQGDSFTQMPPG